MNILEAIQTRKSVRNYNGETLTPQQHNIVSDSIEKASSPFGGAFTIRLKDYPKESDFKPGTYGVIKGACAYLTMAIGEDDNDALSAGFAMEKVVLDAWAEGLGTCWIAATFKGTDFERDNQWPEGQKLRIVSPIGVPSGKRSVIDRLTRTIARSNNRKPFDELFFYGDVDTPLRQDCTFGEALSMLRLAPSSTNSQPWRAVVTDDTVHFYINSYSRVGILNLGIGLYHFISTEQFYNHEGVFSVGKPDIITPEKWHYVTSYIRKK